MQNFKKNKCGQRNYYESHSATGVKTTKVVKKDKDKVKDLSYIKCYISK